jgi:hypothetical protein
MAETTASPPPAGLPTASKVLCAVYAVIAIAALVATWSQNAAYFDRPASFLAAFLNDSKITPASRSLTVDILLCFLAAAVLMVIEARRWGRHRRQRDIPLVPDRPRIAHRQDNSVAAGRGRQRCACRLRRRDRGPRHLGGRRLTDAVRA